MNRRQTYRTRLETVEEGIELLLGSLAAIFAPEAQQIGLPLFVGKFGQILLTTGILVILQQLGTVALFVEAVAHDIAHQPYKGQVNRLTQRVTQRRNTIVILAAEVVEGVHATTGKEPFVGAGGVFAIQRRFQHHRQALVLSRHQIGDGPTAEVVLRDGSQLAQILDRHPGIVIVQLGYDLQIGSQHPQLGG